MDTDLIECGFNPSASLGPVELRELVAATLHEHKCLRDEILQRMTVRNYLVSFLVGFALTLHVQALPAIMDVADPTRRLGWSWATLTVFPLLWLSLAVYLAVNMSQIDRIAVFLCIVEHKLELLLRLSGGGAYKQAMLTLRNEMNIAIGTTVGVEVDLSLPLSVERLLRTKRSGAPAGVRWWDSARVRAGFAMAGAAVLGLGDAAMASFLGPLGWSRFVIGSLALGIIVATAGFVLSHPAATGQWRYGP